MTPTLGHGPWPWPMALAMAHGLGLGLGPNYFGQVRTISDYLKYLPDDFGLFQIIPGLFRTISDNFGFFSGKIGSRDLTCNPPGILEPHALGLGWGSLADDPCTARQWGWADNVLMQDRQRCVAVD